MFITQEKLNKMIEDHKSWLGLNGTERFDVFVDIKELFMELNMEINF